MDPLPFTRRGRLFRYALVALGLLCVVAGLVGLKALQFAKLIAYGKGAEAMGPPPEAVGAAVAKSERWERTLRAVGTVSGAESVEIRNEVPGVVSRIDFNSGTLAEEGRLLLSLEADVERSQLATASARLELAKKSLQRARKLHSGGAIPQAELDERTSAHKVAEAEVATLRARLDQKLIKAPFRGRLGIREVNVGQFLNPGTRITVLDAAQDGVFVDFSLPQEAAGEVAKGTSVRIAVTGSTRKELPAQIVAVEPRVDAATRNLAIRARVGDTDAALRPGMFVEVEVVTKDPLDVVVVPSTALIHASFGDSVFAIVDKKPGSPGMEKTPDGKTVQVAQQQFVRVGPPRGDFVAILEGLKPGTPVVTAGAFKLRNGAPVVVGETPLPDAQQNPTPENR